MASEAPELSKDGVGWHAQGQSYQRHLHGQLPCREIHACVCSRVWAPKLETVRSTWFLACCSNSKVLAHAVSLKLELDGILHISFRSRRWLGSAAAVGGRRSARARVPQGCIARTRERVPNMLIAKMLQARAGASSPLPGDGCSSHLVHVSHFNIPVTSFDKLALSCPEEAPMPGGARSPWPRSCSSASRPWQSWA